MEAIGFKKIKPTLMVILGSGGHTWEMINVLSKLNYQNYLPIYIIGFSDSHSLNDIINFEKKYNREYFYERIVRPRENYQNIYSLDILINSFRCFFSSFKLMCQYKPDYILANGPSICVPIILCGWFLKKLGYLNTKLIYIESAARVNSLSISCKIIKNFVDDIFGFWKHLCDHYNIQPLFDKEYFHEKNTLKKFDINNNKKNKNALITVGTTCLEQLINFALNEEFHDFLIKNGFNKLFIQIGNYKLEENIESKKNFDIEIFNFMSSHKFNNLIKNSDMIISHGGAGTLIQCILSGKKPIAIANTFVLDNHQKELINILSEKEYIYKCSIENLFYFMKNNFVKLSFENKEIIRKKLSINFLNAIGNINLANNNENIGTKNKIISIVIPSIYKDIFRLKILLISINRFVSKELFDKIYIIISNDEYQKFEDFIYKENILKELYKRIIFIKESELIPSINFPKSNIPPLDKRNGWFKQQIFKLAIANKLETKFYLILDSDCLFIKNFNTSDVFIDKNGSILSYIQEEEIFVHEKWWEGSAELLGIINPFMNSLKSGIGVTPQILSVEIVKKLSEFIENKFPGKKWYSILWSKRVVKFFPKITIWTEYTLYYLFAKRAGLFNKYHLPKKNCFCYYYKSIWEIHEIFESNLINSKNIISPILVCQSNTNISHFFPKAFLNHFGNDILNLTDFISCIMLVDKNNLSIKNKNSILSSINCYNKQNWRKEKREMIILCEKNVESEIKELINIFKNENISIVAINKINKEKNIFNNINDNINKINGNYIALWPINCWSSPFRLSIQYDYIKEKNLNKCVISPYIKAFLENEKFFIIDEINPKISLFYKKQCLSNFNFNDEEKINEKTLLIEINDDELSFRNLQDSNKKDAIKYLQCENTKSLFYQLIKLTNPFLQKSSIIPLRNNDMKKIYVLSSELEFFPVIGGINTFLRVIISELGKTEIHIKENVEFIFIGLQTKSSPKNIPKINGITFKFFSTEKSKRCNSLINYFEFFGNYEELFKDLQNFGKSAMAWIEKDSIPGDIFISTIIYEINKDYLKALNKKGLKIIHTVHSLVPLKIINTLFIERNTFKEKVFLFLFNYILKFDENSIQKICENFELYKIIPLSALSSIFIEKYIMNIAQDIIVPSKKLSANLSKLYPDSKSKIRCIPWGLPEENIFGEPPIYYKERNKNEKQKIKCLVLSKISLQKGIDILLDSFIHIENINPSIAKKLELNICGNQSYLKDEKFKEIIDKKWAKLNLVTKNFKGWIYGQDKIDILQNSDLFLLPSLIEPFGFCILEAMKAGLPIVSFNTEGPEDIITNKFGRLVKISTNYDTMAKDFGNAIIDIIQDENFNELRKASAEAIKNWDIKKLIEFIIEQ